MDIYKIEIKSNITPQYNITQMIESKNQKVNINETIEITNIAFNSFSNSSVRFIKLLSL